ncbi:hypothetical protein C5L23_000599 [Leuconostoc fallax]|uniref:Uncharacterized protein n=1 Tax=Leuconostoc fallax TaxID=1251 RepID=A0A4R5N8L8_9LACO|nr:hypothetical protein C5L23_000599 [Leuconostoc fallax]
MINAIWSGVIFMSGLVVFLALAVLCVLVVKGIIIAIKA